MRIAHFVVGSLVSFLIATAPADAQTYTVNTFDPPGSAETYVYGINDGGVIAGYYFEQDVQYEHGFVRDAQGNFTSFDVSGAYRTFPSSINDAGTVAGYYNHPYLSSGFVRDAQGNTTLFDVAGSNQSRPFSINAGGVSAGSYQDSSVYYWHGFVRDVQGNITPFDVPGSVDTSAYSVNIGEVIAGYYDYGPGGLTHGFVRDAQGNITTFDVPGSTQTSALSINDAGYIAGVYTDANYVYHGFVRDASGMITSFDPPGSINTYAWSINGGGVIAGNYNDLKVAHGYVRDAQGNFTYFDPPGGGGPVAMSINVKGSVTGYYRDSKSMAHGFIADPGGGGIDISYYSGDVSDQSWQEMVSSGIQIAVVEAWGLGGTQSVCAQDQLVGDGNVSDSCNKGKPMNTSGAQNNGLLTGAYAVLTYLDNGEDGAFQIDQAIAAVGLGLTNLKAMVVDVEPCCGEFVNWQPSHSYAVGNLIEDSEFHIQKVQSIVKPGKSGAKPPTWNDSGGTTPDYEVTWLDTGEIVIDPASRVTRICEAVSQIQAQTQPKLNAIIYTSAGFWQTITGNAIQCPAPYNAITLTALPLWDTETTARFKQNGVTHCGDGFYGLQWQKNDKRPSGWANRLGNQYDTGPVSKPSRCGGNSIFGISAYDVDSDYFDLTLFQ